MNDLFLKSARGEPTPSTPIWLMRQAGRYLPEYRESRKNAGSFMGLATHPERACEVTLQPLLRFDVDAAILFSDILTVPDAMGLGLTFTEGEGPRFAQPLHSEADVRKLCVPDMQKLRYVFDAVALIRKEIALLPVRKQVPLIGFAGSPWTLACYMVEGRGSSDFLRIKTMLYQRPDLLEQILAINADSVAAYLNAQIAAGAQVVMIFDSWGGALSDAAWQRFSARYTQRVLEQLNASGADVPRIVFTKGGGLWLRDMAKMPCQVLGLDWTCNLGQARQTLNGVRSNQVLQGNLDPAVLLGTPAALEAEVRRILESLSAPDGKSPAAGHIFNLGHGIHQTTAPEMVAHLVEAVHRISQELRKQ